MPITTAGRSLIAGLITGAQSAIYNSTNAYLGVGNGTVVFNADQTDLQGVSKLRKAMEAGFPTTEANILTFKSSFGDSDANFAWEEWGIFNNISAGTMLCRKVENKGTKNGGIWNYTVKITVNISN